MSGCRVAIIADDLTGAMDAAAPFAERGAMTRVVVSSARLGEAMTAGAGVPEVLAVNTASRHLPAEQAADRVSQTAGLLSTLQPEVLIKKVDSTLRGQVIAECLAVRRLSGRRLLVAPAVPAQGRVVRDAEVFVDGKPLAATTYGQDALSVPPCGPLDTLFAEHGLPLARHVACAGESLPRQDCVVDAEDDEALERIASLVLESPREWLLAGAAGVTRGLAQCLFGASGSPALGDVSRSILAVGSRSPQARRQLAQLLAACPDVPIVHALERSTFSNPLGRIVLVTPGESSSSAPSAEAVAADMAETVARLVAPGWGRLLFLTGGDIAMAVLQRLDGHFIEVVGEWSVGVPFGYLNGDESRPVMTKAGGFGDDRLLVHLWSVLQRLSRKLAD